MATQFGYDPIWFVISVGVVMVEDGSIHPPVGMSVRDPGAGARRQDHSIHPGIIPFLIAPLMPIVLMFLFPSLARWLLDVLYARQCGVVARLEAWPDPALNDGSPPSAILRTPYLSS